MPIADAVLWTWTFGLAAGWHFRRGRGFAGSLGVYADERLTFGLPGYHEVAAGPELRLGGRVAPVFIYGLGRVGPLVSLGTTEPFVWIDAFVAPGVEVQLHPHFVFGGEVGLALGGEAFCQLRARAFLGATF